MLAAALTALVGVVPACAGPFPSFTATAEAPGLVALRHGEATVLRWRSLPGEAGRQMLVDVASRLNTLAWDGLSPEDFSSASSSGRVGATRPRRPVQASSAVLKVKGQTLLRVDQTHAALAGSTPQALASIWVRNLQAAFSRPYVMAQGTPVRVPVGETRTVTLGGRPGTGAIVIARDAAIAGAEVLASGTGLVLRGLSAGIARFSVSAGDYQAPVVAEVRPWAVLVRGPVEVAVTGRGVGAEWAPECITSAIWQRLVPEPGAEAAVREVRVGSSRAEVRIEATAPGCFGVSRPVYVALAPERLNVTPAERTVLSNEPERVAVPMVLARAGLVEEQSTTLLWHHISVGSEPLSVRVALVNTGAALARVHVLGADGGPSEDEVYAGHVAMRRFVAASVEGSGCVFTIPPLSRVEVCRLPMAPGQIVSGLAQLRVLAGGSVAAEVEALALGAAPAPWQALQGTLEPQPGPVLELPGTKQMSVRHEVGKAWQFARIGKAPEGVKLHPRLRGDYGVWHDIEVTFSNPQGGDARLEIGLRGGGGAARAVVQVDGQAVETGLLSAAVEELLYRRRTTDREVRVHLRMAPQSGSNYPLTLTARSFE